MNNNCTLLNYNIIVQTQGLNTVQYGIILRNDSITLVNLSEFYS